MRIFNIRDPGGVFLRRKKKGTIPTLKNVDSRSDTEGEAIAIIQE